MTHNLNNQIHTIFVNAISVSLVPIVYTPLVLYFYTRKPVYFYMFCATIWVGGTTEYIKQGLSLLSDDDVFYRPGGTTCALYNGYSDPYAPAFPSGHVGITTFVLCALLFTNKRASLIHYVCGGAYICLMGYSRYMKQCHNIPQIIGGLLYGMLWSLLFY
jgi:membrane-associated phospholipid phosphatase